MVVTRQSFPLLDSAHLALMLSALLLSYALPFELVLLSYAILGPAHYLTEISWLHERSYFLPHRLLAVALLIATILIVLLRRNYGINSFLLGLSLSLCVALAFSTNWQSRAVIAGLGLFLSLILASYGPAAYVVTVLVPSLVHVSLFTFIFMLVGYLNSRDRFQMALAIFYVLSIALILVYPPVANASGEFTKLAPRYFGGVSEALAELIGAENIPLDSRLAGFLSFAYTYHYLNWFIKVRLINWHKVPTMRLATIALLSAAATGLYFFDYGLGISLLFSLSLLHVMLEFPLNAISFRQLISGRAKAT